MTHQLLLGLQQHRRIDHVAIEQTDAAARLLKGLEIEAPEEGVRYMTA